VQKIPGKVSGNLRIVEITGNSAHKIENGTEMPDDKFSRITVIASYYSGGCPLFWEIPETDILFVS